MQTDIHIYGVRTREAMINATAAKLNLTPKVIHYDDRQNGGPILYTARKAWLADIPNGVTHRIVFQDDVEVCDGFREIVAQIAEAHPRDVIGFFPFNFQERISQIEGQDTPYFLANPLSACGIMMPVEYIQPCFNYISTHLDESSGDDYAIQEWARYAGVKVLTTIPALIQHIGDESIANKGSGIRRTVYYQKNPQANWSSKKILHWREFEWFFSNHGKRRPDKGVLEIVCDEN